MVTQSDQTAELCRLGVTELAAGYRSGKLSPVEVARATLDRIAALNPRLNAFLSVLEEPALVEARAAESLFQAGIDLGPLQGVPVSVKDIINVRGTRTTAGSAQLLDAPLDTEDATIVTRLRQAGAVLVGKTHLYEFASGIPDPDGPFPTVQNPRKIGHQTAGSSSGAGAAAAAGLGVIAIGTDTGGSIRIPAALCGLVGLKATYGRVPVRGVLPLSVHLDHVGPLTRSVADAAHCLQAIAGFDPGDPFSARAPIDDYAGALSRDPRGLRVAVAANEFFQDLDPVVAATYQNALAALRDLGLTTDEVELPRVEDSPRLLQMLVGPDAAAYHDRYRGRDDKYGSNILEFILIPGRKVTGIAYVEARRGIEQLKADWERLFDRYDLIVTPGCPIVAPPLGIEDVILNGTARNARAQLSRFSRAFNLTHLPALVMPTGVNPEGLPTSIQIAAPPFGEARLLAVAQALESALGVARRIGIEVKE